MRSSVAFYTKTPEAYGNIRRKPNQPCNYLNRGHKSKVNIFGQYLGFQTVCRKMAWHGMACALHLELSKHNIYVIHGRGIPVSPTPISPIPVSPTLKSQVCPVSPTMDFFSLFYMLIGFR